MAKRCEELEQVCGFDEVGTGAVAGPFVVVGIRPRSSLSEVQLDDSKALSEQQIASLAPQIGERAIVGVGVVHAAEVNELGWRVALRQGYARAYAALDFQTDLDGCRVVVDGVVNQLQLSRVETMPKADSLVPAVMAASIFAKDLANLIMRQIDVRHPEWGFAKHFGYPTDEHLWNIAQHGVCPEHHWRARPVQAILSRRAWREGGFDIPEPLTYYGFVRTVESQGGVVLCRHRHMPPEFRNEDW